MRRAKLRTTSQEDNLTLEVLTRHQLPSVAWLSVTLTAKRTQGVNRPQCESVKVLSPVIKSEHVSADILVRMEGKTEESEGHGFQGLTGVVVRSMLTR